MRSDHVPVLAREVCEALAPCFPGVGEPPAGVLVDTTCGLGGHTLALLQRLRPARAVAFDRDPAALAEARARLAGAACPIDFVHAPFSALAPTLAELGLEAVAAIVADLGVSSMQLDRPERGFSWRADAPLDMRMDPSTGPSAAEILATIDEASLTRILRDLGEEPDARRIAHAIVEARPQTTTALAEVVATAMSARQRRQLGRRIHPATRTFMALRIYVNDELEELDRLLEDAPHRLMVGGRLAIITFHSLEDRRVKAAMREASRPPRVPSGLPVPEQELPRPKFSIPSGYARGITPSAEEVAANPRARSARLRVLERTAA